MHTPTHIDAMLHQERCAQYISAKCYRFLLAKTPSGGGVVGSMGIDSHTSREVEGAREQEGQGFWY